MDLEDIVKDHIGHKLLTLCLQVEQHLSLTLRYLLYLTGRLTKFDFE
jgi:hypothetical protein